MVRYNVEVTGAGRLYRAASVWTAGLELFHKRLLLFLKLFFSDDSVLSQVLQFA